MVFTGQSYNWQFHEAIIIIIWTSRVYTINNSIEGAKVSKRGA